MFRLGEQHILNTHAKVNLGLRVLGKRADGFHELLTLMHEIDLHDELIVSLGKGKDALSIQGVDLPVKEDNLLFKTLKMLREDGLEIPPLMMKLKKEIPVGGGLGGGSSNAIGLLCFLGKKLEMNDEKLTPMAARLGSDTNFFLRGGTGLCRGRGEKVEVIPDQFYYFNLLFPKVSCSTPRVFSQYREGSDVSELGGEQDWLAGRRLGANDLLGPCCRAYPFMETLFQDAKSVGIDLCLSGSGSTCYTIHRELEQRNEVNEKILKWKPDLKLLKAESFHRS